MKFLKQIWRTAPVATTVLAIALIVLGVFAVRLAEDAMRPDPPRDVAIEDWMTPRLISHSWKVPRREMAKILGLENEDQGRQSNLRQLAEELGISTDQLILQIETGIADFRTEKDADRDRDRKDD